MPELRFPILSDRARIAWVGALALAGLSGAAQAQQVSLAGDTPLHLTLPAAIDLALAHNRKLALAQLAIKDQEQQKRIAESSFYPLIANESRVTYLTHLQGVEIPASALSSGTIAGPIPAQNLYIDQGSATSYTSGTGLAQPITQAFKIRAGVKAANAELSEARIKAVDAESSIALAVRQVYYGFLIEQLRRSSSEAEVKAATVTEEETKRGVQEGRLLEDAELQSRSALLEKQRSVLVSKLALDDWTLQLDDLLGLPLGRRLELDGDALGHPLSLPTRQEAIAAVLLKSPAVLTAMQDVAKAKAGLSAARDAYIPNITGTARYSYQSGLPFLAHNFGSFGASMTYDLFDGGAREDKVHDARIKLSMAETQLAQVQSDVRIELSAAYDKLEAFEQLVAVAQSAQLAREESARIQERRGEVDAELASGVETAHAAVTSAKLNVLTAQLSLFLTQSSIKKLLGETPR